ncbi:methyl-accepting chemotaxis protein [Ornithinibacillus bavariensis]|uniref:Sensory transducer protein YvaQ n=1 Tax=Ornithinibacillus bavariensis TaxID=545502 RepID=A0A919X6I3_9BACI|nr:methyl-accepting chemotaxis protein [Ornithinibacillus bavariensis]GIO25949.1 putative sensory transducer protein YvaQ [Ornithinibacillus bavariensis]
MLRKIKLKKFSFRNLRIGIKYGVVLAVIIVLFIGSSLLVTNSINKVGRGIDDLETKSDIAMSMSEMGSLTRNMSIYITSYLQKQDPKYVDAFKENQVQYNELSSKVRTNLHSEEQKRIFEQITSNNQEVYRQFTNYIVSAIENGNLSTAESYVAESDELREETITLLNQLVNEVNIDQENAINHARENQKQTYRIQTVFISISIVIGVTLLLLISIPISRNLKKVVHISNQIAEGNLSVSDLNVKSSDEIGELSLAIGKMSDSLKNMIQQVSSVSGTVTSQSEELTHAANEVRLGAEQVASTMQELAAGSEKQADNASNLSNTMQGFSKRVVEANENGEQIHQASTVVLDLSKQGSQLMHASIKQMTQINGIMQDAVNKVQGLAENSRAITKLVSVIRDIADQTNLLALNAAIEAARAGEHGKGFAVVADEVRKLSEQVGLSVSDISAIVHTIQTETNTVTESLEMGYQEVQQGTKQIHTTNETFDQIKKAITEMTGNIQIVKDNLLEISGTTQIMGLSIEEIAAISEESAAGIEQTSASSQQTSSSMEEMVRSSEDLAKLAEELNALVQQFKI